MVIVKTMHSTFSIGFRSFQHFHFKSLAFRAFSSRKSQLNHDLMISRTKFWVTDFVYRQQLCPWSGTVLAQNKIRYVVLDPSDPDQLLDEVMEEVQYLVNTNYDLEFEDGTTNVSESNDVDTSSTTIKDSDDNPATTLLILPYFKDFDSFFEFSQEIEEIIEESDLDELVQVATFHPDYVFEDSSDSDAGNYTNRSPYPVVHILLQDDVTAALEKYPGDPDDIWKKNIRRMRSLGRERLSKYSRDLREGRLDNIDPRGDQGQGQDSPSSLPLPLQSPETHEPTLTLPPSSSSSLPPSSSCPHTSTAHSPSLPSPSPSSPSLPSLPSPSPSSPSSPSTD